MYFPLWTMYIYGLLYCTYIELRMIPRHTFSGCDRFNRSIWEIYKHKMRIVHTYYGNAMSTDHTYHDDASSTDDTMSTVHKYHDDTMPISPITLISRYIVVPTNDKRMVRLDPTNYLLAEYYGDRDSFIDRALTIPPKLNKLNQTLIHPTIYKLIEQMINYGVTDWSILQHIVGLTIPNISQTISGKTLSFCLNRGVTFFSDDGPLSYENISYVADFVNLNGNDIAKFHRLNSINVNGGPCEFRFLQTNTMCETLTSLIVPNTRMSDIALVNMKNLQILDISHTNVKLDFLTPSHPLCETIIELHLSPYIKDDKLAMFQKIVVLQLAETTTMQFLMGVYKKPLKHLLYHMEDESTKHPLCYTIESLDASTSHMGDMELTCLVNLRKLTTSGRMPLNMITKMHPLAETILELNVTCHFISERAISHLRNLKKLTSRKHMSISYGAEDPTRPINHSLTYLDIGSPNMKYENLQHMRKLNTLVISTITGPIPDQMIPFDTVTHLTLPAYELVPDTVLTRFTSLRRVHMIFTFGSFDCLTRDSPLCETLEEIYGDSSNISDASLRHLRNLRILSCDHTPVKFSFIYAGHPLTTSIEHLTTTKMTDASLCHFTRLSYLFCMDPSVTFEFLRDDNNPLYRHPLCDTITSLQPSRSWPDKRRLFVNLPEIYSNNTKPWKLTI